MSSHKLISLVNRTSYFIFVAAALSSSALAAPSSTALVVSPTSGAPGTVFTLTASVSVGNVPAISGTVLFKDGVRLLGSAQIVRTGTGIGKASIKTASFTTGSHPLTANFVGAPGSSQAGAPSASAAKSLSVSGPLPSLITLFGCSGTCGNNGATVRGFGFAIPTGNITAKNVNSGIVLGTGPLSPSTSNGNPAPFHDFLPDQTAPGSSSISAAVTTADLNADGYPDLISANPVDNTVTVFIGDASRPGRFLSAVVYSTGLSQPSALVIGDFNSDGSPDVAVANKSNNGSGTVSVLLGDPTHPGNLLPAVNYAVGKGPLAIVVGDFNGDGVLDLASADGVDGTLSVLLGSNATPGVLLPRVVTSGVYTSGSQFAGTPDSLASGDFNNDGYSDLAIGVALLGEENLPSSTPSVVVLLSDPSRPGQFSPPVNVSNLGNATAPAHITVGDFNRDGFLDIAAADSDESYVVSLNSASHPAQFTQTGYFFRYTGQIVNADFNGDGALDLLIANSTYAAPNQQLSFMPGLTDSSGQFLQYDFTSPPPGLIFYGPKVFNGLAVADLNGDGVPDLIKATNVGVSVSISDTPGYSSLVGGAASYTGDQTYGPSSLQSQVGSSFTGSRTVINFGSRPIGITGTSTVVFTNTTTAPIQIRTFPIQGSGANDFSVSSGCPSIPAGSSCTVKIVFDPTAVGLRHGDITFQSSAGDVQEIALYGPGTAALPIGPLTFSPGVVEFGGQKVGTSGTSKIAVSNQSGGYVVVMSLSFTGKNPGDFVVSKNTCPSTILANSTPCSIYVTFKPTAVGGRSANLSVNFSSGTYQLVPLTGPAN